MKKPYNKTPVKKGPRINNEISASEIRLIDENGEMVGVVNVADAVVRAKGVGLDLVEISPNVSPPVCKILDYGKFKYEQQKKASEAKKKQKTVELKEIKLRPGIEEHDFQVKMRKILEFIEKENKVKITMRFRGREMAHKQFGFKVLERVKEETKDVAKVEQEPKLEGRQILMLLGPIAV